MQRARAKARPGAAHSGFRHGSTRKPQAALPRFYRLPRRRIAASMFEEQFSLPPNQIPIPARSQAAPKHRPSVVRASGKRLRQTRSEVTRERHKNIACASESLTLFEREIQTCWRSSGRIPHCFPTASVVAAADAAVVSEDGRRRAPLRQSRRRDGFRRSCIDRRSQVRPALFRDGDRGGPH